MDFYSSVQLDFTINLLNLVILILSFLPEMVE